MASAAEAEVGALFMNAQEAVAIRTCLEEMGHPQQATPIKTDNSTAQGVINGTIKQKQSKTVDMRFCWLRDRVEQGQFRVCWDAGKNNVVCHPTKHHSGEHHKLWRPASKLSIFSPEFKISRMSFLKHAVCPVPTRDEKQSLVRESHCS